MIDSSVAYKLLYPAPSTLSSVSLALPPFRLPCITPTLPTQCILLRYLSLATNYSQFQGFSKKKRNGVFRAKKGKQYKPGLGMGSGYQYHKEG
ncbi:unnamed protein product [Lactuca virosa]|uniref:Uncharacterized protein n=1 Tax=Lactuca virosa TaxID=75947 RepID=A0AAU9MM19_9ASTR|nr:unnamed protein product [Lactuca virosa]